MPDPATDLRSVRNELRELIKLNSVLHGTFELASGGVSDVFFDMKKTTQDRVGMRLVAELIAEKLKDENAEYLGGLELGAVPVTMAVCLKTNRHAIIVRKATKERGTNELIEGNCQTGREVIVIDDVTTKGSSVMKAVTALRERGCVVHKVITVVDRLEGAEQLLQANGIKLCALFTPADIL